MIDMIRQVIDEFKHRVLPPKDDVASPALTELRESTDRFDALIEARYGRDVLRNMILNREDPHHAHPHR